VGPCDNAVLHVHDEECGIRPVLKCAHVLSSLTLGSCVKSGVAKSWSRTLPYVQIPFVANPHPLQVTVWT
jgi:hypothetical protein